VTGSDCLGVAAAGTNRDGHERAVTHPQSRAIPLPGLIVSHRDTCDTPFYELIEI